MSDLRTVFENSVHAFNPTPAKYEQVVRRSIRRRRRRRLAAGVLGLVSALLGVGLAVLAFRGDRGSTPSVTPPAGTQEAIAYVQMRSGGMLVGDLYVEDADGGGVRRLTRTGHVSVQTAASPDGSLIAFAGTSGSPEDPWNIFVVDVETGAVQQLTHATGHALPRSPGFAINEFPSWTADGRIRFFRNTATSGVPGPGQGLWEMNADGSGARRLVANWVPFEPTWSPDGTHVAWAGRDGLIVGDAEGGSRKVIVPGHTVFMPAWSPSGDRILFVQGSALGVIAADGTGRRTLFECGDSCRGVGFPAWSPDGRQIAMQVHRSGGADIAIIDADGTDARFLHAESQALSPVWVHLSPPRSRDSGTALSSTVIIDAVQGIRFRLVTSSA